jgi:hypothetical protein
MLGIGEDDLSIYLNDHLAGATAGAKLALGVEGKLALWQALRHTLGADPRLEGIDLGDLISRARSQRRRLEGVRMRAAEAALVSGSPDASED